MSAPHITISCHSYKNNIFSGLSRLQGRQEFVDLTLAADGHLVKVHKNIIALASPYLKDMIQSLSSENPVIFLNNVSHKVLSFLLEYIYQGEIIIPREHLSSFLQVGKSLRLVGMNQLNGPETETFTEKPQKIYPEEMNPEAPISTYLPTEKIQILAPKNTFLKEEEDSEMIQTPSTSTFQQQLEKHIEKVQASSIIGEQTMDAALPVYLLEGQSDPAQPVIMSNGDGQRNLEQPVILLDGQSDPAHPDIMSDSQRDIAQPVIMLDGQSGPAQPVIMSVGQIDISQPVILSDVQKETAQPVIMSDAQIDADNQPVILSEDDQNERVNNFAACITINNDRNFEVTHFAESLPDLTTTQDSFIDLIAPTTCVQESMPDIENLPSLNFNEMDVDMSLNDANPELSTALSDNPPLNIKITLDQESKDCLRKINQFSITERGAVQIILHRFIYCCHHSSKGGRKHRWRCLDYRKLKCPAYVDSMDSRIILRNGLHKHDFHDKKIFEKQKHGKIFATIEQAEAARNFETSAGVFEDIESEIKPSLITMTEN